MSATFDDLRDEDWRIQVDDYDLEEPKLCYPDPDDHRKLVGPLVTVHVGAITEDDAGEDALDMEGADGRNLMAVACLPQIAELFRWIRTEYESLGVSESEEYSVFVDSLKDRIDWIAACVDERPETLNHGLHGLERFRAE